MSKPDEEVPNSDLLFASDAPMARLMASFAWSQTPVGPSRAWPQSLRTAVRIVLTSRFPMWMGWGKELTFFYNDAYGAMTLGAKHPWALGRRADEVWAEIWEQIGPRITRVLATGNATWDERLLLFLERSGFPEETYHTFSYSPLLDDEGAPSGMLCVVSEETERVIGERRLALLHVLAAELSGVDSKAKVLAATRRSLAKDARDLPFTLTYLVDATGRLALETVTGLASDHPAVALAAQNGQALWPLARVLESSTPEVVDLPESLAWPAEPWREPPRQAAIVPIPHQGQAGAAGLLVAGLNRFRPFDDHYRNFLGLFVGQVAAALSSATAYEDERRRAAALAELDRAKTAFFSNVSHEFRTPLTLMLGPTEEALGAGRALAGGELETVHRNQLRLLKLVNTLLDFSRLEAGRANAAYQPLDLATLTVDLASTFREAVERAGLAFEVSAQALPEPVFVDPHMWEAILLNLLSNAFKFTFAGKISVLLAAPAPGHVELSVRDSGVGIPAHELGRVFERFHRIEGSRARTHEGSGIGLALVQDFVKLHGGDINVESTLGLGTGFTVSIPTGSAHLPPERVQGRRDSHNPVAAAAPFVTEALRWLPDAGLASEIAPDDLDLAPQSTAFPPARVLVADDNADMRDYLMRLLSKRWLVDVVANGNLALARAREQRPDLILTDVMMPGLDGFGLVSALRADPALRSIPIIMLSARAGEEARIEGFQAGADDYLVKPFSARELLARVGTRLELQRLGRRLVDERAAQANLFEQTPMPIAIFKGKELVFEVANASYISGIGGRDILGKPLLEALPELEGQGFDELLYGVMTSGKAYVGHETLVRLNKTGTLEDTYWTFIYAPIRDEAGRMNSVIALCNEVTEQVVTRQRLEGLAQEAARANRAKDEFLAMLGHELRNPLAPMLTALQLMRLKGRASREQDVLERQVAHLSRLVDDLLDVSRITRGKIELDKKPLELAEVVTRAMEIASPLLEQSRHDVHLDVPKSGLSIDADPARMAQVVSNLLTNAAKYSDAGTRIEVRGARLPSGSLQLSVKDRGIGIAPEMLGSVFDAFVQQPQTLERSRGGLGLGLTIVKSLVEKHGGSVRALSAGIGQGSEFVVELPALDRVSTPAAVPSAAERTRKARRRDKRILVVDDNEDAALMLKQALEQLGYVVEVAHDGPTALDTARSFQPHVALLDIGLPVMDGYELGQRLREARDGAEPLRLLAITGYGLEGDRQRSASAGFAHHLVKPLDLSQLEGAIEGSS